MKVDISSIRNDVYDALASLSWADLGSFDDDSVLKESPLRLTDIAISVLPMTFSRISKAYGGAPVLPGDVNTLKTVGDCVNLVFKQANLSPAKRRGTP